MSEDSGSGEPAPPAAVRLAIKLRLLNLKHELVSDEDGSGGGRVKSRSGTVPPLPKAPTFKLIPHGDALRLNALLCANDNDDDDDENKKAQVERDTSLTSFNETRLLLLEEPWITAAWNYARDEELLQYCKKHLSGILKYCKKEGFSRSRAKHLVNLLGFKSLFESLYNEPRHLDKRNNNESLSKFRNHRVPNEKALKNVTPKQKNFDKKFDPVANNIHISRNESNSKINEIAVDQRREIIFDQSMKKKSASEEYESEPKPLFSVNSKKTSRTVEPAKDVIEHICIMEEERENREKKTKAVSENVSSGSGGSPSGLGKASVASHEVSSLDASASSRMNGDVLSVQKPPLEDCCCPAWLFSLLNDNSSEMSEALSCRQVVELLSARASPQIVRECYGEYEGRVVTRYFDLTDSVLLLFCRQEAEPKCISRSLRTPVCLRDFCDYVLAEEAEWLDRWRKERSSNRAASKYRDSRESVLLAASDYAMGFRDEDFLLPGSLKALTWERELAAIRKQRGSEMLQTKPGVATVTNSKSKERTSAEESLEANGTRLSAEEKHQQQQNKGFEFIGYELGKRRVQLQHFEQMYEARDGTHLRLEREQWLLGDGSKPGRTSIRIQGSEEPETWSFWYHEETVEKEEENQSKENDEFEQQQQLEENGIEEEEEEERVDSTTSLCHLITGSGVIVAFSRLQTHSSKEERPKPSESKLYAIQISEPSGLIIKPAEFHDEHHPFYILQYYNASKRPGCNEIKKESHRKYLLNGDVVKFFNDGSIIVLRPNGSIISVVDSNKGGRRSLNVNEDNLPDVLGSFKENDFLLNESLFECGSCSCTETSTESLRYRVLELDGRQYELEDGRLVCTLERMRASMAEEYQTEERFARREDGTDALFTADSELIVSFPDGTRSLSGCVVEDELAFCDWSAEELERFFGTNNEPEGFVSVLVYGRVEHPNYAPVARNPFTAGTMRIEAAADLHLQWGPSGPRELCINQQIFLELEVERITMRHQSCQNCSESSSRATFYLPESPESPKSLAPRGRCQKSKPLLMSFVDESNCLNVKRDSGGFQLLASEGSSSSSPAATPPDWRHCRLFALTRDGRAHEYHDRSTWEACLDRLTEEDEEDKSSLICWPTDQCSGLERQIALRPLSIKSTKWTTFDYKIHDAKPKACQGIRLAGDDGLWDGPLKTAEVETTRRLTDLPMIARLFETVGRPADDSLLRMHQIIVDYRQKVAGAARVSGLDDVDDEEEKEEPIECGCREGVESMMSDIAADRTSTIDPEIYEAGRQYLQKLKIDRNEKRTRQMIDRVYEQNI